MRSSDLNRNAGKRGGRQDIVLARILMAAGVIEALVLIVLVITGTRLDVPEATAPLVGGCGVVLLTVGFVGNRPEPEGRVGGKRASSREILRLVGMVLVLAALVLG